MKYLRPLLLGFLFFYVQPSYATITDPTDIANLWLWLDGNDPASMYSDPSCMTAIPGVSGDEVACWKDKSGNAQDVSQAASTRWPAYTTNQFNGKPAVVFDQDAGAEDELEYTLAAPITTNHTTFLVVRSDTATPVTFNSFFSTSPSQMVGWQIDYNGATNFFRFRNSVDDVDFAPYQNGVLKLYAVEYDGTNVFLFSQGSLIYKGTTATTNSGYFSKFKLNLNRSGSQYSASTIAEVIVYNRVLNPCEFKDVSVYLAKKYGQVFTGFPGGLDCAGIQAWWRADQNVTGTSNVTSWTDLSSNAINLTATTGPSVSTNEVNFHPALDFNGSTQSMIAPGGIIGTSTLNDFYSFMVTKNTNSFVDNPLFEENLASGGKIACILPTSIRTFDWTSGSPATNEISAISASTISQFYLWGSQNSTSATPEASRQNLRRDGLDIGNDLTFASFTGNNSDFLLGTNAGSGFFNGDVAEILMVGTSVNQSKRDNVESYLAARYGITLDQSTPRDYTASDWNGATGTKMWTHDSNFQSDIAVIGQDATSGMDQRKSKSQNPGAIVTISNGNDSTNPSAFDNDYDFLSWSNNHIPTSTITVPTYSGTKYEQMGRTWKVNNIGLVGNVSILFDLSGLGLTIDPAQVSMLYGTDSTFSSPTLITSGRTIVGSTVEFNSTTFANPSYFSLILKNNDEKVSLSTNTTTLHEPTGTSTIKVTLNKISNVDVTVNLTFSGTAALGSDYKVSSTSIVIPHGSLSGSATITILDDKTVENTENIVVGIGSIANAAENGIQRQTITIADNDTANNVDSDGDGVPDSEEKANGTDPNTPDNEVRGGNRTLGNFFGCTSNGSSSLLLYLVAGLSLICIRKKHRSENEKKPS